MESNGIKQWNTTDYLNTYPIAYFIAHQKAGNLYVYQDIEYDVILGLMVLMPFDTRWEGYEAFDLPKPDLILSNPPYIETAEIESLQSEVHYEPVMALDGGEDGYVFYEAIADKWINCCDAVAVECGEGQADKIKELFSCVFADVCFVKDFNGIERTVIGRKDK